MPLIQCHIKPGLSSGQKHELMQDLTEAMRVTLGSDPKFVTVIIHELDDSNIKEINYVPPRKTG
jgi:4-oxalocrotonate tautomerase/trans-3-chloroacrylic acid dehalogenase beta subunit